VCLAVPGKVVDVVESGDGAILRMGRVAFGEVTKEVCLEYVPEASVGDYVIVHVGFAISRLDAHEAERSLALWRELGEEGA
jgi:hydrogenase expression/formation protein HypC